MSSPADFDLKERVRAAVDIMDVVGQGAEVRPQGRNFVIRCPFHNDRRPSLTINPERQSWKCWVCDVGGDIFSFVMQRDGVDFPTALRFLAEQAGIPIDDFRRGKKTNPGDPDDRPTLFKALEVVEQAYYNLLESGTSPDVKIARDYLESRGIDESSRRRFRIGFAPDDWSFAVDALDKHNFRAEVATAAGVAIARPSGEGVYDRFRGRLMFPIHDLQNRVISMGGRVIPAIAQRRDDSGGGSSAKYINGPETLLFKKSNQLYGLQLARDSMRHGKQALVMEGYTDVVAARQAGIEPVVAVLGTALGEQHVKILKRFTPKVVLVLDGDTAGQTRADQVLELFVGADVDLRVMTLPNESDPADFIADHGREAFEELVRRAPDALDFKLSRLTEGVDLKHDTHDATAAMEGVLAVMAKAPQTTLRHDQMLVRLSEGSGISVDRLARRLDVLRESRKLRPAMASAQPSRRQTPRGRLAPPPRPTSRAGANPNDLLAEAAEGLDEFGIPSAAVNLNTHQSTRLQPISGIDRELFETLIESPELAGMAVEAIDPNWLSGMAAKMLLSAYQDLDLAGRSLDVDTLLLAVDNEQLKNQVVNLVERVENRTSRAAENTPEVEVTENSATASPVRERSIASGISATDVDQRYTAILTRYREREFDSEKERQIERLESATLAADEELALLQELVEAERFRQGIRPSTEPEQT